MSIDLRLGPGAEFDAIRDMLMVWGDRASGIGDDAAVVRLPRGDALVVSTDAAVEDRHFVRAWLTPAEIGHRAVTAALSDLAAMAAQPVGVLTSLIVPRDWRDALGALAGGMGDAVAAAGAVIVGGNLSDGEQLSITTTVLGRAFVPLARAGALPGDAVYVTGQLGAPRAAIVRLRAGRDPGAHLARLAHPSARIAEARWLADRGATAAIDISDGLVADARHLAAASGVHLAIDAACVPCVDGVVVADALASGEEYELLVTARAPFDTGAFARHFALPLTRIGVVQRGDGVSVAGARPAAGWDHFSS